MPLAGKVALVTGAGRNMGRAIAVDLARHGVAVAVNARASQDEVTAVVSEISKAGGKAVGVLGDVGSRAEVLRIVGQAQRALGSIDILVNTVAIRPGQAFLDITEEDLARVMAVNLYAPFWACQAVLPDMVQKKWGRIINFSGRASFEGAARRAHVSMTKTGIVGMMRTLALEFGLHGVTVNTIVPGTFDTERMEQWPMGGNRALPNARASGSAERMPPVGRLGLSQEIADLCTFLVSDSGAFITGQSLHINGGAYVT